MKFIKWLFAKLGFVPVADYNEAVEMVDKSKQLVDTVYERYAELCKNFDELNLKAQKFSYITMEQLQDENKQLKLEHDKIQSDMQKTEEFYKEVQKALQRALQDNGAYVFRNNLAIPGSTSVDARETEDGKILIKGRTIMMDQTTDKIQHTPSLGGKYNIALSEMIKYGVMDKITQYMVKSGAMKLYMAYNADCTSIEVYYEISCNKPDVMAVIE